MLTRQEEGTRTIIKHLEMFLKGSLYRPMPIHPAKEYRLDKILEVLVRKLARKDLVLLWAVLCEPLDYPADRGLLWLITGDIYCRWSGSSYHVTPVCE